ncbi:hypothetical protein VT84_30830 [Gemmata sp. SH-PL17]|uniref:hypothetical protein n=1 Tax=Gemmata sp. SH-PL17 TaxID=1630693 RepID=UPI00078DDC13|nr:hypothetical protein [Gemmata sp. SH-PL17]AMV28829.1 hypothetical protein VT84_30830 [Gemmata sp. SH-PL17]
MYRVKVVRAERGAVELDIDGRTVCASLTTTGLNLAAVDETRCVPWPALVGVPAGYGILRNGWHIETVPTEVEAIDRVNDLRGVGDQASYFRIAH